MPGACSTNTGLWYLGKGQQPEMPPALLGSLSTVQPLGSCSSREVHRAGLRPEEQGSAWGSSGWLPSQDSSSRHLQGRLRRVGLGSAEDFGASPVGKDTDIARGEGMEAMGRALRLWQAWRALVLQDLLQATSAGDEGLARPPERHPATLGGFGSQACIGRRAQPATAAASGTQRATVPALSVTPWAGARRAQLELWPL